MPRHTPIIRLHKTFLIANSQCHPNTFKRQPGNMHLILYYLEFLINSFVSFFGCTLCLVPCGKCNALRVRRIRREQYCLLQKSSHRRQFKSSVELTIAKQVICIQLIPYYQNCKCAKHTYYFLAHKLTHKNLNTLSTGKYYLAKSMISNVTVKLAQAFLCVTTQTI